jgi:hypothetical protein
MFEEQVDTGFTAPDGRSARADQQPRLNDPAQLGGSSGGSGFQSWLYVDLSSASNDDLAGFPTVERWTPATAGIVQAAIQQAGGRAELVTDEGNLEPLPGNLLPYALRYAVVKDAVSGADVRKLKRAMSAAIDAVDMPTAQKNAAKRFVQNAKRSDAKPKLSDDGRFMDRIPLVGFERVGSTSIFSPAGSGSNGSSSNGSSSNGGSSNGGSSNGGSSNGGPDPVAGAGTDQQATMPISTMPISTMPISTTANGMPNAAETAPSDTLTRWITVGAGLATIFLFLNRS